jgi:hypothetical protein
VPGLNLGHDTDCPDFFVVFLSSFSQPPGWPLKLGHDRFLLQPFGRSIPTNRCYVLCAIDSVVKQTIQITFADDLFLNYEHFVV